MATCSSVLAWRMPWTDEPGGLQFKRSQTVGHNWATNTSDHKKLFLSLMYHFYNKTVKIHNIALVLQKFKFRQMTYPGGHNSVDGARLCLVSPWDRPPGWMCIRLTGQKVAESVSGVVLGELFICFRKASYLSRDISMLPASSSLDFPVVRITCLENLHLFPLSK